MVPNIRSFVLWRLIFAINQGLSWPLLTISQHCGYLVPFKTKSINCKIVFCIFFKIGTVMAFFYVYIFFSVIFQVPCMCLVLMNIHQSCTVTVFCFYNIHSISMLLFIFVYFTCLLLLLLIFV